MIECLSRSVVHGLVGVRELWLADVWSLVANVVSVVCVVPDRDALPRCLYPNESMAFFQSIHFSIILLDQQYATDPVFCVMELGDYVIRLLRHSLHGCRVWNGWAVQVHG
jgi:hypothetical protein